MALSEIPMSLGSDWWDQRLGRRLKLRDLQILFAAMHWGSMSKAAGHLRMSQPAVSEAITNLESFLRVRLLDRTPRGIEPTIYAEALLKRGRIAFDELGLDWVLLSSHERGAILESFLDWSRGRHQGARLAR